VKTLRAGDGMSPFPITETILLGTLLASLTDWLFMDVVVQRAYRQTPELWRPGETLPRILLSQIIGISATAATVLLCIWRPGHPICVAITAWCAGALPMSLQHLQWLKIAPAVTISHAAGWLVRLLIAALLANWILPG
jgi:hypothetical protein